MSDGGPSNEHDRSGADPHPAYRHHGRGAGKTRVKGFKPSALCWICWGFEASRGPIPRKLTKIRLARRRSRVCWRVCRLRVCGFQAGECSRIGNKRPPVAQWRRKSYPRAKDRVFSSVASSIVSSVPDTRAHNFAWLLPLHFPLLVRLARYSAGRFARPVSCAVALLRRVCQALKHFPP